ncbi:Hypothetical predicted protein [Mytilus galloprovincialis]|uniref:Peptidase aspartic putative domain-containing protein n=1 Tax=Mytilus galloprovincialis TaxID=29158 RepID=A0A8B6DWT6_MYTGA|nr:Hypothetical predicted protein [Mytilus galloprovincialis]
MCQPSTANHTANFVASVKKDFGKYPSQGKTSKYKGMNFSNNCTDVAEHEKRIAIIKKKKMCFNCFGTHKVSDCRSKYDCRICHRKHTLICKKNTTHQSEDKDNTETSILYTSASQETSTVLLKTAVAKVMSVNNSAEANILFDEGAQRSFITSDLATKLNVQKEGSENLNIVSFRNKTSAIKNLDKTTRNFGNWSLLGIDEMKVDTQLIDFMETFAKSSITKQNGKYVSKLPWKKNCPELPTNKEIVKRRTENVIRRISKDKEMFRMYGDIIFDQERRVYVTLNKNYLFYAKLYKWRTRDHYSLKKTKDNIIDSTQY